MLLLCGIYLFIIQMEQSTPYYLWIIVTTSFSNLYSLFAQGVLHLAYSIVAIVVIDRWVQSLLELYCKYVTSVNISTRQLLLFGSLSMKHIFPSPLVGFIFLVV